MKGEQVYFQNKRKNKDGPQNIIVNKRAGVLLGRK
jgi:hypothetical protein